MRYLLLALSLLFSTESTSRLSNEHIYNVYIKLIKANHLLYPPVLEIVNDSEVSAHSDFFNETIVINTGLIKFAHNDAEIARTLGHELGHFYLRHILSTQYNEYQADRMAAYYMQKAGYNKCTGAALLYRRNSPGSNTHPSDYNRWLRFNCSK